MSVKLFAYAILSIFCLMIVHGCNRAGNGSSAAPTPSLEQRIQAIQNSPTIPENQKPSMIQMERAKEKMGQEMAAKNQQSR